MPKNSYADVLKNGEQLVVTVRANTADLQNLTGFTTQLEVLLPRVREALVIQATAQASFQQATRNLEALVKETREMMTRLRAGVKSTYGYRSEKLVEFGLKPLRKRPRLNTAKRPPSPAQTPEGGAAA